MKVTIGMRESEKDRIARQTADLRVIFDMALSNRRKYPVAEFNAFVQSARRYIEITARDPQVLISIASKYPDRYANSSNPRGFGFGYTTPSQSLYFQQRDRSESLLYFGKLGFADGWCFE
ncbi:MAG TPA: hypothetical protein VHU83_20615 [Bryobacteraceae bacterium]|jgi:hypothetical protein|nr:hypothetical protein [Bryobacteraceae bacterium]